MLLCCLFFFKQKTAYEMRISDWSSDVCSSDLALQRPLSRFACLRHDDGHYILQNAETHARLTMSPAGSHLLKHVLEVSDSAEAGPEGAFRRFLYSTGFLEAPTAERPERESWEFHDLLFHDATRLFLGSAPLAKGDRLGGRYPKPEAVKPPMSEERLALPDPGRPRRSQSLRAVVERRKSIRTAGDSPLTLGDLSSFLWRTVRARDVPGRTSLPQRRPMPSGGGVYELEFYLAVDRCEGVAEGFYHYRGVEHALYRLPARPALVRRLTVTAASSMGEKAASRPDCVMVIAARLPRIAREYKGIAYRLSLLHAGIAMESFYLTATDMGLSPCAIGTGDSSLFEELTGLPPLEETAVAEFALSGPASSRRAPGTDNRL